MRRLCRRRFVYCVGGLASGAAGLALGEDGSITEPISTTGEHGGQLQTVRRCAKALGSTVAMTVVHPNRMHAERGLDAAFSELELVEGLMSIYRPDSQLSRLNRDGSIIGPHPYLINVLNAARHISARSQGAFDVTIQPLWELFAQAQATGRLPSAEEIESVRKVVDWRRVDVSPDCIRLHGQGTRITLNGIAQGFAADRVAHVLRQHDIAMALIDTGEIGTLGSKPRTNGWKIGIQHPRNRDAYVSVARLASRCLATSGDYETTFSEDQRHHHLFDPRTGCSPTELSSVTILAETALLADALSTAVFVMGLDSGTTLIRQTPRVDALIVAKDGRVMTTDGFPNA